MAAVAGAKDEAQKGAHGQGSDAPEILELSDLIKQETPAAAKRARFEFGRIKIGKARAGSQNRKNIPLPFLDAQLAHHVPNGWLYPMLAAFTNVGWNFGETQVSVEDSISRTRATSHR